MGNDALVIDNVSKTFYRQDQDSEDGGKKPRGMRVLRRRKKIRSTVVDSVSLRVPKGATYGVLGPNGSGKSTLVRMVATLLLPDSGSITVFGHDVKRNPRLIQQMINRVSVDAAFFKKLSAFENLLYTGRLYGIPGDVVEKRTTEILDRLGFDKKKIKSPMEELSRGMQQKIAIARGFLTSPILLLLDEPTTGLDPKSKRDVEVFIKQLREEHDSTILLTTHDMAEAEALCDKIAILDGGKVVALDTPDGLKAMCKTEGKEPTLEDAFMQLTGKPIHEE